MDSELVSILFFGEQSASGQQVVSALADKFGSVEIVADGHEPRGRWIWCLPEHCELPMGALLRAQGIVEGDRGGVHLFAVHSPDQDSTWSQVSSRVARALPFLGLERHSPLLRVTDWKRLFHDGLPEDALDMDLLQLEERIWSVFGTGSEQLYYEPESVLSHSLELVDLRLLYRRSSHWRHYLAQRWAGPRQ